MATTPKNTAHINIKGLPVKDLQISVGKDRLFLIALKDGQKVARIRIDDMPNDKFFKTVRSQRLQGRTCEFELQERK